MERVEVQFVRTGVRRYAIEIRRRDGRLRMDPAPGFDDYFPHDLQHLIVEEQLGLDDAIFGRLAKGGTAATFSPVDDGHAIPRRAASRQRRRAQARDRRLGLQGSPQFAQSERATYVAWHDWLSHCPEAELRQRGASMAQTATEILDRMDVDESARLTDVLPQLRHRVDEAARRWNAVDIGDHMSITWSPAVVRGRRSRRSS